MSLNNKSLPRVYLIDASIYIFRAWHTFETTITDRDGRPANAVFGFGDFLYQLLQQKIRWMHFLCSAIQKQFLLIGMAR